MTVRSLLSLANLTTLVALAVAASGCLAPSSYERAGGYGGKGFGFGGGVAGPTVQSDSVGDEIGRSAGPAFLATLDPAAFAVSRMVARNATLSIELPVQKDADGDVDKKATQKAIEQASKAATAMCKELKGWVVYESANRVVLRIPSQSLDAALEQMGALGEVTGQTVTGTDVTDKHRDNGIRLDNLEKSRQRYLKLLEAAEDVKAALSVEKELQRVTLEIERLKGHQKSLETSVAFSLVTVSFAGAYPPKAGPMPGPIGWIFYGLWWVVKWLFVWE